MVIRVRDLINEEGNKLRGIVRHGQEAIEVKRAQVILASAQGFSPPKISQIALMSEDYIRELIRAFNEHGMAMLKPKWGPGRPSKFTDEQRKALVELATSRPRELDLPYAEWSLSRLREEAIKRGVVPSISEEWLRVILHEADVSHQSIRTWKQSTDPQFEKKKRLIEWLTDQKHNPPIVLSVDEIGPIQLIPHGGGGWFPRGLPGRIPAEYSKKYGTTYYFLGLNVFHQELWGRVYRTKHSVNWLEFLQGLRSVSHGPMGVHHSGQREHALDRGGAPVGVCPPHRVGAEPHEGELAQPRGVPRRRHSAIGASRTTVHDGGGGGSGARCGGDLSQHGAEGEREDVPGYGQGRSSEESEGPGVEAGFLTREIVHGRATRIHHRPPAGDRSPPPGQPAGPSPAGTVVPRSSGDG